MGKLNINVKDSRKAVFDFFEEISLIPRGSGNTKGIADYLVSFAKSEGLEYYDGKIITLYESACNKYVFGKLFFANKIVDLGI